MITCIVPDCARATRKSPTGAVYAMCDAHTCKALTDAFGTAQPQSWSERAAARTLPTSLVGGLPATRPDLPSGADRAVPPVALIGPRQGATAATTAGGG